MFSSFALASLALASVARAQQVGTNQGETHPNLSWGSCTKAGGCSSQKGTVTVDANWRWTHNVGGSTNCYTGNTWNTALCPSPEACATNCAVDGADYKGTYGVTSTGTDLTLGFVTYAYQKNVGSRLYLLDSSDSKYQMFKLKNREFTFDVDVSKLPCGLNGALYFVEMDADGGVSKSGGRNTAGAKYGTGYCDAQCAKDIKFINGKANIINWTPSSTDPNSGTGNTGSCCNEMDIWEANSISTAFTPHSCSATGLQACTVGVDCDKICDQPGCDYNSFRLGNQSFYGPGKTVDTTQRITVVTQFITADGTDTGALSEIRRLYVQNGKVISNSKTSVPGITTTDSISPKFCTESKSAFAETEDAFTAHGGFSTMDASFQRGHVLVMSLWDDHAANMLWLDSQYPVGGNPAQPGIARGTCPTTGGIPSQVEQQYPSASVTYGNIKFGEIGSTYTSTTGPAPGSSSSAPVPATSSTVKPVSTAPASTSKPASATSASVTSAAPVTSASSTGSVAPIYGQCGGNNWTGPKVCASGSTCKVNNEWYSQCIPN